jgi:hypothetical protein
MGTRFQTTPSLCVFMFHPRNNRPFPKKQLTGQRSKLTPIFEMGGSHQPGLCGAQESGL